MKPRTFTRKSAMPIIMILAMFLLILGSITISLASAEVTELNVPPEVVQGGTLSISGKAAPNEEVWIGSSFEIALPVSEGKYSRDFTGIHFPEGEKNFSVFAEKIKDIEVSLSPVNEGTVTITCSGQTMTITVLGSMITYPLDEPINETDAVEFSISLPKSIGPFLLDITGKKDIAISGDAADDATSVNLGVAMSIKVIADSRGDFELDINTGGVPLGQFMITAGGEEKTVEVVKESTEPTPTPSPSPTPTPTPTPSPGPTLTPSPSPTPTPTPSSSPTPTPTSTPSPTITPQPTPIKNETTPPNKTNQPPPRETPKPFFIPGFEAIGCMGALIIIVTLKKRRLKKRK